ncbi:uncharacterized protein GGS25DRAFT_44306 [Hypoxylon fragiforme]|uniref:uncharacterized protein n=1 Tax=Hypoxylon fragiforme TaxID=63214 RepID=UPI0020C71D4F|nr:uncharacterized protein GGS25DRAFT_44306 [Hypoxylon fragiforme]KAI2614322.1 hypothetical protein GGS25DRAFT_44306 [Hypoxylon fragiforme]
MSYAYQQNNVVPDSYYETAEDAESLFLGMDLDMAIYLLRAEDWSRDDFRALTNALAKYDNGNYQEPRNHDSWTPSVWANHLLLAGKVIDACRFLRDDEYCRGELPTTLYVYAIIRLATAHMCGIRLRHYVRTEYEVPEPVVESPPNRIQYNNNTNRNNNNHNNATPPRPTFPNSHLPAPPRRSSNSTSASRAPQQRPSHPGPSRSSRVFGNGATSSPANPFGPPPPSNAISITATTGAVANPFANPFGPPLFSNTTNTATNPATGAYAAVYCHNFSGGIWLQ